MNKEIRIEVEEKIDMTTRPIKPKRLSKEETQKRIVVEKKRVNRRGETSGLIPEVPEALKEKYADIVKESNKTSKSLESWKRFHPNKRWYQLLPKDGRMTLEEQWWNTVAVNDAVDKLNKKGRLKRIFRKLFCKK
jgi:hypothetical protein